MASSGEDSRIINPVMHSLFHLALVRTAVPLFNDFDVETLESAFTEIQLGNAARFNEGSQENCTANTVKEKLLFIPAHLRHRVLEAVMGLHRAVFQWKMHHSRQYVQIKLKSEERILYWRSDGVIDRNKTAQRLVRNANINIRERFEMACMYCLEKSVQTLWTEMDASGQTENCDTANNPMTVFWVRWMLEGSRVPWLQAVRESLELPLNLGNFRIPKFSAFFPLLRPEDRERFLSFLKWSRGEDFRLCLYSATKEEEEQILQTGVKSVLLLLLSYLDWPLQSFFLQTAEKLWNFIDASDFNLVLNTILNRIKKRKDFDYCELFLDFWNRSPHHLKESARNYPRLSEKIDLLFNDVRQKRRK